ncbi:MAG: sodium:alanine symporter family protein [Clostridia bacterium]|nr:sodium:alanine symporter family protein [Clostridia bacterium]
MEDLLSLFDRINASLVGALVPIALMLLGIYYIVYLRAFHLRHPIRLLRVMAGGGEKRSADSVSPFRAVTLALAGTLGVGNLVGVSGAIALGGPGAIFWMLLSAFLAMLLKYAETVLAMRHRTGTTEGRRSGGAMYYMRDFLMQRGKPRLAALVAGLFAVLCIADSFTMGSIIQMNAAGSALHGSFGWDRGWVGIFLALLTLLVTAGGAKRISALTGRLVPLMTLVYIVLSVAVLILKRDAIPDAVASVFSDAFSAESAAGGALGFFFSRAVRFGTIRGLMSNEAGCGTAPIAHAEATETSPAEQGLWGLFEVFADTILLCTMTALVVLVSYDGAMAQGADGMLMTLYAYSNVLGAWCEPLFAALVLFFAFATVICRAHYGRVALSFFTDRKGMHRGYLILFAAFVFVGTVASSEFVWTLSDLSVGIMTLLNLCFLFAMRREVKAETMLLSAALFR